MVVFLCGTFFSLIYFQDKNSFKCTNKAASIIFLEIEKSVNQYTYEAPGYYLPQKNSFFLCFFCRTRANMQQVLQVQAGLYWYDEWMVQEINDENLNIS